MTGPQGPKGDSFDVFPVLDDVRQLKADGAYYRRKLLGGVSAALASGAIPALDGEGSAVAVAVGAYGGSRAVAIGFAYNTDKHSLTFRAASDTITGSVGVAAGYMYKFK